MVTLKNATVVLIQVNLACDDSEPTTTTAAVEHIPLQQTALLLV